MIQRFKPKSEFSRNVLTLMTGTTIAQAIPIAISPILTRIYTPEDFGVLALYISLVSIFSVIATLRYELAIMQPRQNDDAAALVVLSVVITSGISLFLLVGILVFNEKIQALFGNDEIGAWLFLCPVSVFLTGLYQALNYWNTRKKQYKKIASSKISQGVSASATQVGFGGGGLQVGCCGGIC